MYYSEGGGGGGGGVGGGGGGPGFAWSAQAQLDVGLMTTLCRNTHQLEAIIDLVLGSCSSCNKQVADDRKEDLRRLRRGGLLPLRTAAWSLQLLDVAYMQYRSHIQSLGCCGRVSKSWTYWTADSSPISERNWMNSGYWEVPINSSVCLFRAVQRLACETPNGPHSTQEGPALTRKIMNAFVFHQLPPVQLGWRNESAAAKLSACLWAASLETGFNLDRLMSMTQSVRYWITDMGTELTFSSFTVEDLLELVPWFKDGAGNLAADLHKVAQPSDEGGAGSDIIPDVHEAQQNCEPDSDSGGMEEDCHAGGREHNTPVEKADDGFKDANYLYDNFKQFVFPWGF